MLKPAFQSACRAAVEALARETADGGPAMLIGSPWVEDGKLYNACALLDGGRIAALRFKANLPNYGVFDEKRLFARGPAAGPVTIRGIRVGVPICEDIWLEESEDYENVVECLAETGAEILVVPNGSPYARDKNDMRLSIAVARVTESGLPLIYLNQVGGQDELVFDGASFALNADLSVAAQLPAFEESITTLRWTRGEDGWRCAGPIAPVLEGDEADYAACVLGLRDYVAQERISRRAARRLRRHRFRRCARRSRSTRWAQSACAASCCRFASPRRCRSTMRPSSQATLGIRYEVLPIANAVNGFEEILSETFKGLPRDITEENLQARTRGTLLMAISNKTGAMVVTTGNKSEMSVGYATLYGDMNGGFNPIKDIYKTEVFRLSSLAQFVEAGWRARAVGRSHPGQHHHAAADRGAARKPDRPGFAAALRCAGCDPGAAGRARGAAGLDRRRGLRSRDGGADRSAAQHRRVQATAGRTRRQGDAAAISAATAAIPSPTVFATRASRCRNPTRSWCRAPAARRPRRSRDRGQRWTRFAVQENASKQKVASPVPIRSDGGFSSTRRDESRADRTDGLSDAVPGWNAAASGRRCVRSRRGRRGAFLPGGGPGFTSGGRCIFFALSSVTMMSPCCSAAALSSIDFSASDQVWPGALQAQDGLNSWRKRNAFGSAV